MKKTLTKPKKIGRPRVADNKLRRGRMEIRVTPDEKLTIIEEARLDKCTVANWIRARLGLEAAEYRG